MKKRLLSAFLALAMVLTLIPATVVPAFAAYGTASSNENGNAASYHAKFDNAITDESDANVVPGWFVQTKDANGKVNGYAKITDGVIYNNKYYDTWDSMLAANSTINMKSGFTVVGNVTASITDKATSVNAKVYKGGSFAIQGNGLLTSVDITGVDGKPTVTFDGLAQDKAVTINLTNVDASGATINAQTKDANGKALGNKVTLNNSTVGAVTLGTIGTTQAKQTFSATNSSVADTVTLVGTSSTVTVTDSNVGAVSITGTGGSFNMSGYSKAGDLSLFGISRDNNGGKDGTAVPPSVEITAGTVGNITYGDNDAAKGNASVKLTTSSAYTGAIIMNKGTVEINSGHAGDVTVKEGALNVKGANATAGNLSLGETKATTLNVDGTGHVVGTISGNAGNMTLNIPESRTNTYTSVLDAYVKHTIKGGTWKSPVKYGALDMGLAWQLNANSSYTYYTQAQLGDALTAQVKGGSGYVITPTSSAGTGTHKLSFISGSISWGEITGLSVNDVVYLPSAVNSNTAGRWTQIIDNTPGASFDSGARYTMPDSDVILNAGGGVVSGNATSLLKVDITSNNVDTSVRASIVNNVITLTGSLPVGTTPISLRLTTDVQEKDNKYATVDIVVVYYSAEKKLTYQNPGNNSIGYGMTVPDLDRLRLNNETIYTLSASVKDINGRVILDKAMTGNVDVTVNASAYGTAVLRDELKKALQTGASFNWTNAPAIVQAINDVLGGTTDSQITTWLNSANRTHYLKTHQSVPSTGVPTVYSDVYLVPYLAVTVTEHNSDGGSMKASMVPMYRIEARATGYDNIVVQAGRTLGALTGSMSPGAQVAFGTLKFQGTNFGGGNTADSVYAHQDDTYVYVYDQTSGMTVTHAGANGLGTFTISKTDGMVKLYNADVTIVNNTSVKVENPVLVATYSTLQAAVNDAQNGQYIEVNQNYTGSTNISVTGTARTIYVQAVGKNLVIANASGNLVESNQYGNLYSIKLNRDTAPVGGNITISGATGGSASVSANPATAGQTVTITLSPSSGYTANGVSVKTSTGATVSVSGSGNSYTFTMPSGTVTVTPSFKQNQAPVVNPTITVGNPTRGSGTAVTNAGTNQVAPGSTVTVTTAPASGQRTMGLTVTGATANRTGANTFTFTVPSGYNTVVVTPQFDVNNGTLFTDVWSSEYFSPAVAWAVGRGITNGTSTYTFGSYNTCTREDMVTFLWRAAGSPVVTNTYNPFWDVQVGSYYYNAVLWAVSKGITNGVSANQFGVGQYVTRGQAVTFLYRYNGSPAASTVSGFYDVPSSEYYAKAVSWANATGVTNGTSTTAFSPNSYCQRAQIVTFLYRNATGIRA